MKYEGDMRMTVATELRMNYPSSMFMSLPVRLSITGFSFHATAVIAYLQRRVNFCFLEPKTPNESLLKDVHIESEVGNKEKQVLKNVGKVERFIVDQLRNVIDEEFVFPSYFSIEFD
ncbi:3244_t:CDS:2, partial [Paraglomus occultum]